jgi:archaellum biogenesis ATPase FlaH
MQFQLRKFGVYLTLQPYMGPNFLRPIEIEMIRSGIAETNRKKIKAGQHDRVFDESSGLLLTKKAGDWMKQEYGKPAPKQLFGGFWCENELCILFADTNLGKSVLAVQIADSLTKLCSTAPFYNYLAVAPNVLYLDFELSSKQFEARYYSNQWGSYLFADSFYRSEFNPAATADVIYHKSYNDFVNQEMERAIQKTKATVLVIDNITYMRNSTAHPADALDLMKTLKALKAKYKLSLLVLAHTPKRNPFKPITVNDLQGSKMLINFADSAFAIGQSQTSPGLRYLKQVKQRSQKEEYGESNVCIISLENHLNFLRYKFEGYAREQDHLRRVQDDDKELIRRQVLDLHNKGYVLRKIADEVGIHFTTAGKILRGVQAS